MEKVGHQFEALAPNTVRLTHIIANLYTSTISTKGMNKYMALGRNFHHYINNTYILGINIVTIVKQA